jgi:hypothetical protein
MAEGVIFPVLRVQCLSKRNLLLYLCAARCTRQTANPRTHRYPFIDQKLPTANTHEHSSDGRDRYSGVGQIDGKPAFLIYQYRTS